MYNKLLSRIFTVLLIICVFTACNIQDSFLPEETSTETSTETMTEMNTETAEESVPEEETAELVVTVDGIIEEKNEDQLFEQSALIIRGVIEEKSPAFQIQSVYGSVGNYTDYTVRIAELFRGEEKENRISVRLQGGTAGGYTEIHTSGPDVKVGEEYVLFLYQPGRGGAFNTEGEYYYILGLTQGIFSLDDNGMYVSQTGHVLALDTILKRADEYPVDPDYFRNEYIENQKLNLQNGFITAEEYQKAMDGLDIYAVIKDSAK